LCGLEEFASQPFLEVEVGVPYLLYPEAVVVSGLLGAVLRIIFFLLMPLKPGAGTTAARANAGM
jgi:hypothetical protein